jgi:copper transport protein
VSRLHRRATATGLALAALLALAGVAGAHAQLVASSPAPGEVLGTAPVAVRLTFSEPLEARFSSADVIDADGTTLVSRGGTLDPSDAHTLVVKLPSLASGVYTVTWRSLSAADGHPDEGFFSFGVGNVQVAATSGQGQVGADPSDPVGLAGKWIAYLGLLLGIGLPIFTAVVLRGPAGIQPNALRIVGGLLIAGGLALLGLAVRVPLSGGDDLGNYLIGSRTGLLAIARSAVMVLGGVSVILLSRAGTRRSLGIAAGAALVGIGLHVAAGHAAASGSPMPVFVQLVHLVAAGTWLAGVLALAVLATAPAELVAGAAASMRVLVPRFSAVALVAIGIVSLTGVAAEWMQIGGLPSDADPYGRAMILKVIVVVAALAMGAFNFLDGGRGRRWLGGLRPRMLVEAGLGVAVLVVTALLSTTSPLADRGVPLAAVPSELGTVQDGIGLSVVPGRPGVDQLAVDIHGTIGDLPLYLLLDRLDTGGETRIQLAGIDPTTGPVDHAQHASHTPSPTGIERYVANALVLPVGSSWDANVIIGNGTGGELIRQRFSFEMGDGNVVAGVAGALADGALGAGALLLLGGMLGLGLGFGRFTLPRTEAAASRIALVAGGALAAVTGLALVVGRLAGSG